MEKKFSIMIMYLKNYHQTIIYLLYQLQYHYDDKFIILTVN